MPAQDEGMCGSHHNWSNQSQSVPSEHEVTRGLVIGRGGRYKVVILVTLLSSPPGILSSSSESFQLGPNTIGEAVCSTLIDDLDGVLKHSIRPVERHL